MLSTEKRRFFSFNTIELKAAASRAAVVLLIFSFLTMSTPAATVTITTGAQNWWQAARFTFLSSRLAIDLPNWFVATLVRGSRDGDQAEPISHIKIFPGDLRLQKGQDATIAAVAFDRNNEPLSGIRFEWSVVNSETGRPWGGIMNSVFTANRLGTYSVKAKAGGREAEVRIVVTPQTSIRPRDTVNRTTSSRTGLGEVIRTSEGTTQPKTTAETKDEKPVENHLPEQNSLWGDDNWTSFDDPGNQTGNPPGNPVDGGAGNGNFQLSAPVIALPGRGIDIALSLNYNSRVWNKAGNELAYNIGYDEPAPGWTLGFGKLEFMGPSGGCMMVDADGTRHGYAGSVSSWSSGATFTGHTTDGSFIDYGCGIGYGNGGSGWARLPNGTVITYNTITSNETHFQPVKITDAQGNYITITYGGTTNAMIQTVTDTIGRVFTFHYDSLDRLNYITGPRMTDQDPSYGTGSTRVLVRLHYKTLTLNYSFGSGITPVVRPGTIYGIDAIYYPATNTGYWFGDTDSYSSYGMIAKVIEQRGMSWTAGPDAQGTVTQGTMTKQADYNYPLTAANVSGRTNGIGLTDAPTYSTLAESWDGADVAGPAITTYNINQNSSPRTTTVIQPNGTVNRQYAYNNPSQYNDGLVYSDESYAPDASGSYTIPGLTGNFKQVAKSNVTWSAGNATNYDSPRPTNAEVFDENGSKVSTAYTYGTGKFNQITKSCDYDNGNTLLRCATATYENDPSYIGSYHPTTGQWQTGNHVFNLVKSTAVENSSGTKVSRTDYEYDNYTAQPFTNAPGVIQHEFLYDVFTTYQTPGSCLVWGPRYQCGDPYENLECQDCEEWEMVSAYDPSTEKRGNITKTTVFADAQNATGPIVELRSYDITGNMVKASSACCEETSILYDDPNTTGIDSYYAYPFSQTRGASSTSSPHRITTSQITDFKTGLTKSATDANGRTSTTGYNPDTLRPDKSTSSTGAYSLFAYDDTAMTVTEEAREANNTLARKTIKYLNGIGQVRKEESFAPSFIDIVETKYTKFGEEWKQSRPYRTGDTVQWSERFYDDQRRLIKVVEPDGSETKAFYNETTLPDSVTNAHGTRIRVMDAWGRERWGRYDQQGRLVQVVEPNPDVSANPTGSVLSTGSLLTKYIYDTQNRLIESEQGAQLRKFKYDDLGRLTRQKLAEQTATLNDNGDYVGLGGSGSNWTTAYFYDSRSNLIQKNDARGIKALYSFYLPAGGGLDPLNRLQWAGYDHSGPLDTSSPIYASQPTTYSYMTTGDKTRIQAINTTAILAETFTYDVEGRVSENAKTVQWRGSHPFVTSYLYDTLDRVKEVHYPAQYGLAGSPRKIVANTYDTASRLSTMTVGGQTSASDIVYNAADQTTQMKVGTAGTNQITEDYTFDGQTGLLTNQKATKNGSTNLLDLSYQYDRGNSAGGLNGKTGHLTKTVNHLDTNKNREYEFDAVGRLTKANGGTTGTLWSQTYTYDRYGNRTNVAASGTAADSSTIPIDGIPNLTYNSANNRITTTGFEYDVNGNQIRAMAEDGVTWVKYEYDSASRIRRVRKDDKNQTLLQEFEYANNNARLLSHDPATDQYTIYASVGGTVLAEYTEFTQHNPSWVKSYSYLGSSQLSTITPNGSGGETTEYNHPDRLGTRTITNQAGGTSSEQAHLPFGRPLDAESSLTTNNKRFTSYDRSSKTGLDYAINRTYDSKQGRFTQVDPIGMQAVSLVNPQTLNLYSYCGNDPINHVDPSGLFFGSLFKWIGKIFKAIMTVLKWVVIAIVVAAVLIAIFHSGGAAVGFLKVMLGLVGKIIGLAAKGTSLIITNLAATVGAKIGVSIGAASFINNALFTVGVISSSFAQTKDGKKKRQDIIEQTVRRVIDRLKTNSKCLKTINYSGIDLSPIDALTTIASPNGTGDIVYNGTLDVPAQTVVAQTDTGVIELGDSFFMGVIKDGRGNDWNKITGLNELRTREFIILHELRHLFGSDHGNVGLEKDVQDVLRDCFGINKLGAKIK